MKPKFHILAFIFSSVVTSSAFAGDIEGIVQDKSGKAVTDAVVAINDEKHKSVVVRTNASGNFSSKDLPEGTYGIAVTTRAEGAAFLGHVEISATGAVKHIALILDKSGTSLHGTIRAPGNSLPAGIQVFASRISDDLGDQFYATVEKDRYDFSLVPGSYVIFVGVKGWYGQSNQIQIPRDGKVLELSVFPEKGREPKLADELLEMEKVDQEVRFRRLSQGQSGGEADTEIKAVDEKNALRIKQIILDHGWPDANLVGLKATRAMWLLVQHGPDDLLKKCLPYIKLAAERGELSLQDLALSIDRDLVHDGKKQIYGTQVGWPIDDEEHVDQRRAKMEMGTLAEYNALVKKMSSPQMVAPTQPSQN